MLRCPTCAYGGYSPANLGEAVRDPHFQLALYLASPTLWEALDQKRFDVAMFSGRERLSLLRYYNRMCFRPTPFGAFASFTVAALGTAGKLRLIDRNSAQLHLEVDQELALHVTGKIVADDLMDLSFAGNPLLYVLGKELRFIRTVYGRTVEFEMESLPRSELTNQLFAGGFRKGAELVALIRNVAACAEDAAIDYLRFLVDAGLLLPHTGPNIIGQDYLRRLLSHPEVPDSPLKGMLSALMGKSVTLPEVIDRGKKLRALLPEHKGSPFYAGLERSVCSGALDTAYQPLIRDGLDALEKLVRTIQPPMLAQFIRDFSARFDRQKVPLLQALDPDAGIVYGALAAPVTDLTLLKDVNFQVPDAPDNKVDWSAVHRLLLGKWQNNYEPIRLNEEDMGGLPDREVNLPPSLSVLFRLTADGLYLESVGGASVTALIGRFTAWSDEVHQLGKEMAMREQAANPDVVFADIGQLSDSHADNINRRAAVYDYEIPVNAVSLLPVEQQVALSDLWISVAGEELVLESRSLNKVVIPRLSSAYNYSRNNLSVFRLLCDLQYQGIQGNFSFSLEDFFPGMDFYPRVVYKQTILCLATWHLSAEKIIALQKNWAEMRNTLRLPPVIALSKGDQQLVFRLDEAADVAFLLDCLKGLDQAVIQEYLLPADIVKTDDDKVLVSQFIACLTHNDMVYTGRPAKDKASHPKVRPVYSLGSKWLYLKLYVSPAAANALLTGKLLPLLKQLGDNDVLTWFFIRYNDTGHHIRLRLQVREEALGRVLLRFNRKFGMEHLLREYQADTYRRELERYGPDIMEKTEAFFHGSSVLVLAYLKVSGSGFFPYHSLAFVSVNEMVAGFFPGPKEQLLFLNQMTNTFFTEFSGDKSLRMELDRKYRELKGEIGQLLLNTTYYSSLKLEDAAGVFSGKMNALLKVIMGFDTQRRTQLLADLIHMHLNRLFTDQQRKQELIIYYCLYKHRLSLGARR